MNQTHPAESRANLPILGFALLWSVIVFFVYFTFKTHPLSRVLGMPGKLFDLSSYPSSTTSQFWAIQWESLLILLTSFLIAGATWALGRRLRQWFQLDFQDPWVAFAFDFGLGICFLNLFWMGTGLERLWFKPLWITAGILSSLLFAWDVTQWLKKRNGTGFSGLHSSGVGIAWLVYLGGFYWFFSILQNLVPETFYDSMVYHLAVPSYWLLNHGITDFSANFFSNYPFGAETYFLNGLVFQGTESAKMLHLFSFGACALLAGGWAKEIAGRDAGASLGFGRPHPSPRHTQGSPLDSKVSGQGAGWLTLGLTLTLPLFAVNLWTTQVEGFLTMAVLLFIYALSRFVRNEGKPIAWALQAGLFGGLAVSTKYTAILAIGSSLAVLAVQKFSVFKKEKWKYWFLMLLGSLILLGPWLLKNDVFTGNPFFPYLMDHFSGRHLPAGGYERLLEEQRARVTTEWWSWLLLPWTLTMANPDSYNFCGPLALALAPLLFLFKLRHPVLRFLAGIILIFLISGFAVTHILRFVLPVFVLLYILLGSVLAGGNKPSWGKGAAWMGVLSAVLCLGYLSAISHFYYSAAGVWSGCQTRPQYLQGEGKITPYLSMAQWINDHTTADSRLLIVGDARGLYYERPFLTNTVFDEQALARIAREEKDTGGIARHLRQEGVDYLVVNGLEGIRVSPGYHHYDLTKEEWERLDDFVQRGTEAVFFQKFQGVYRILPALRETSKGEMVNLVMFFSKPAADYFQNLQRREVSEAREALGQVLELYPFSKFWNKQKMDFDQANRTGLHG